MLPDELSLPLRSLLASMLVPAVRLRATIRTVAQSQWYRARCSAAASMPSLPPPDEPLYEPGESEGSMWSSFKRPPVAALSLPSSVMFVSGDEG